MGIFWKSKRNTKNTSDNNITINSHTDILLNIGKDIGNISANLLTLINDTKKLKDKVYQLEKRISILEKRVM